MLWRHDYCLVDMNSVESRFRQNTKLAIEKVSKKVDLFIHKGFSDDQLVKLLSSGKKNYFDFNIRRWISSWARRLMRRCFGLPFIKS